MKKKQQVQSATSLPQSPDAERRIRMVKYTVAMAVRLVCLIVAILVPVTWWTLIPVAGAIFLPYIAVVLANTVIQPRVTEVERPGSLVRVAHHASGPDA